MAGISEIENLEARKRALVNECEICRENLRDELQHLAHFGAGLRKRVDQARRLGPWLVLGLPLLAPVTRFFSKKQAPEPAQHNGTGKPSKTKGVIATALLGLRLYRRYEPVVRSVVAHWVTRNRRRAEDRSPAANR